MKEKLNKVLFNIVPQVRIRVIETNDKKADEKKKFPFKLDNDIIVTVFTTPPLKGTPPSEGNSRRNFSFKIKKNYIWNGADIPRCFWRLIGSRTDNAYLKASISIVDVPTLKQIKNDRDSKFLEHPFDAASYLVEYFFPIK